jgi:hypothetical protein
MTDGPLPARARVSEVIRLEADLLGGRVRIVDRLGAEVAQVVGDPPEPEPSREVLLVELEIHVVARIAVLAAPHLQGGPGVAEERHGLAVASPRGDRVRKVRRPCLTRRHALGGLALGVLLQWKEVTIEEDRLAGRDQVGIGHEILKPVHRQHLLDPGPHAALAPALGPGRRRPLVPRTVGALREPDAPRCPAEVPAVCLDGGPELEVNRLVTRQERQVAVGRGAGDDLDVAGTLEIGEGAGNIAPDPPVHLPHPLEELLPEVGQAYDFLLALAREVVAGFDARAPDVVMVKR